MKSTENKVKYKKTCSIFFSDIRNEIESVFDCWNIYTLCCMYVFFVCQIAKTTAQCHVVEVYKRSKRKKTHIDFTFDQFQFHSTITKFESIVCLDHCACWFFVPRSAIFHSWNRMKAQMAALFRLSSIQLTHCKLLLYNRLTRCSNSYSQSSCSCIYMYYVWNFTVWMCLTVVTSIKLTEV